MSALESMLPLGGGGGLLCAWLLGVDLLLAVLMIALILLRSGFVYAADAAAM